MHNGKHSSVKAREHRVKAMIANFPSVKHNFVKTCGSNGDKRFFYRFGYIYRMAVQCQRAVSGIVAVGYPPRTAQRQVCNKACNCGTTLSEEYAPVISAGRSRIKVINGKLLRTRGEFVYTYTVRLSGLYSVYGSSHGKTVLRYDYTYLVFQSRQGPT